MADQWYSVRVILRIVISLKLPVREGPLLLKARALNELFDHFRLTTPIALRSIEHSTIPL